MVNSFYYSFLALPLSLIVLSYYVYLPKWYADYFGATVSKLGLFILLVRLFDALTDPICGVLSDLLLKRGFSRFYLLIPGVLILVFAFYLLLSPDFYAPEDVNLYFLVVSLVFYLGSTLVAVPYESIGISSSSIKTRARLLGLRDLNVILGTLLASVIPIIVFQYILIKDQAIESIGIIYGTLLIFSLFLLFLFKPDIKFPTISIKTSTTSFKSLVKLPFSSSEFKTLSLSYLVSGLGMALPASLFLFFCEIVLGLSTEQANLSLLVYFGIGILFLPMWILLSNKFPIVKLWFIAQIINAGFFLPVAFLSKGDYSQFLFLISLSALGFGGAFSLPSIIQAQIVTEVNQANKGDFSGAFMGIWSVIKKFSQAIGSGLGLYIIGQSGLDSGQLDSETLQLTTRVLYAVVPSVLSLWSIYIARGINIDRA
jgi:GPH family glycoside/pentoside/hexuronide:cation symporter